jgi:hypothetical protein
MWIDNVELQPSYYVLWFMLCFFGNDKYLYVVLWVFFHEFMAKRRCPKSWGYPQIIQSSWMTQDDHDLVLKQPWWLLGNPPTTSEPPHFRWESFPKLGRADPGIAQPRSRSASPVEHLQFTALSRLSQGEAGGSQGCPWTPWEVLGWKKLRCGLKGKHWET